MDRLKGTDWLFLATENADTYMHMCIVAVLDPSDAPGLDYDTFRSFICERFRRVPRLRRRLRDVPLGLDFPILVDDPDFDPASHVHRVAVPAPGGRREVAEILSALLPVKLDRRRSLWEVWYLEGLAEGRVGYFGKIHHALFDGVTAVAMARALFDTEPKAVASPSSDESEPVEPDRSSVELLARGLGHLATTPVQAGRLAVQSVRQLATLAGHTWRGDAPPLLMRPAPTPWNVPTTGPRRALAFADVSLAELKRLCASLGVSVNDAVCAITGGGLRAYLMKEGALPDRPVVAVVPVSPRLGQPAGVGTDVTGMVLSLGTDIDDPVDRVLAIHNAAVPAKKRALAVHAHHVTGVSDLLPPALLSPLASIGARLPVGLAVNTIVSNTPGFSIPIYCAGARVEALLPCAMSGAGMGLAVFVTSYVDDLEIGVITDPDLVPDPWSVIDLMKEAFHKLQYAAELRSAEVDVGGSEQKTGKK